MIYLYVEYFHNILKLLLELKINIFKFKYVTLIPVIALKNYEIIENIGKTYIWSMKLLII